MKRGAIFLLYVGLIAASGYVAFWEAAGDTVQRLGLALLIIVSANYGRWLERSRIRSNVGEGPRKES